MARWNSFRSSPNRNPSRIDPIPSNHLRCRFLAPCEYVRLLPREKKFYHLFLKQVEMPLTIAFIVIAPLIGMASAYLLMIMVYWLFRNSSPAKMDVYFRKLQLLSAAAFSGSRGRRTLRHSPRSARIHHTSNCRRDHGRRDDQSVQGGPLGYRD